MSTYSNSEFLHNLFSLKGKTVLVTGASSGIGQHCVQILAKCGANVVAVARRKEAVEALAADINQQGGNAYATYMDVCDENSIRCAVKEIETEFSPIDVLVNNAGIALTGSFLDTSDRDWRAMLDTNVIGLAHVARYVAKSMKNRGCAGSIINVASILGERPGIYSSAYAASKAAVIHLSRNMSIELARYQIRVNSLLPGFIPSELSDLRHNVAAIARMESQIPMARVGAMDDLDGALVLLCSDASKYMSGSTVTVDGGHASHSL